MAKYRKKPVVIEAIRWMTDNYEEIHEFVGDALDTRDDGMGDLIIVTLEGAMIAKSFDWIIKGVNGEFYPCKPDIFEKTYDAV